jgi:hypothetical protein
MREVVDAAFADMQRPNPVDVLVGYDEPADTVWLSEAGEIGRSGFQVFGTRGPALLVAFADWLQEQFFAETRAAWGQPRPPCPGHSHPAEAALIADEAWWTCPVDQRQIAPLGRG